MSYKIDNYTVVHYFRTIRLRPTGLEDYLVLKRRNLHRTSGLKTNMVPKKEYPNIIIKRINVSDKNSNKSQENNFRFCFHHVHLAIFIALVDFTGASSTYWPQDIDASVFNFEPCLSVFNQRVSISQALTTNTPVDPKPEVYFFISLLPVMA